MKSELTSDEKIQRMSNWQNHQWLKAGGKRDAESVNKFFKMQRRP